MNKPLSFLAIAVMITSLLPVPASWAYQEIEVKDGGSIKGKAVLIGEIPQPRVYHLILFPNIDMCAEVDTDDEMNRLLHDFTTDSSGGLKNVVIALDQVDAGKPFNKSTFTIHSENCKFMPEVNPVKQGETFKVDNLDAVMHNSQVYQSERGKIIENLPIPPESTTDVEVQFQKNFKIFQMICGMHEFMQTWGYRVQNPYYAITGADGTFSIDNIPPGEYDVTAWHYLMKPTTTRIKVESNSQIALNFEFAGKKVVRPLYETIKSGRIKKDAAVPGSAKGTEVGK
ncbi:MAG: hypothetical protein COV67_04000 [Nitrospinae bacterium CG11_big_fil_rev_8_21_14_0_20_56_8]|nr:MAG: hypothetical protein COV67_04000 [Nitrospinae bacterium CG11_big_fil_rev_8_21_14_0_20_56_8]